MDQHPHGIAHRPFALVFSRHPAPYRDPVFSSVHDRGAFALLVAQYDSQCVTHPEWEWLPPPYPQVVLGEDGGRRTQAISAIRLIRSYRPDVVVVPGLGHATSLAVLAAVARARIPFVYSADTVSFRRSTTWSRPLRDQMLRAVLRRAGAAWVPGRASRVFFESQGMQTERVFEGCYCLDDSALHRQAADALSLRGTVRASLGIGEREFAILFVGAMIPSRRVCHLVEAFRELRARVGKVSLVLVGGGPEHPQVLRLSRDVDGLHVVGPVPVSRLPSFYSASDAYVHAGSEPYSLALVQAVLAGLPVVTTRHVGAALDFVEHGVNGYVIDEGDDSALVHALATLAGDVTASRAMGANGALMARERNLPWATEQLEFALRTAMTLRRRSRRSLTQW